MDILFITDSKYPNNWIMRKSTILKQSGHNTHLSHDNPDKIYISCVFKQNADQYNGIKKTYEMQGIPVECGGTGFNLKLDTEIDHVFPDYELYPSTYSMGFTTRGCPNECYFCIVPQKEGHKTYKVQQVKDFHHPDHDMIMLLDNNILQDKEWFFSNTDYIIDNHLKLWEHGMDARAIDDEIAQRIKELPLYHINYRGQLKKTVPKFAFDNTKDKEEIINGMDILKKYKIKATFYVYCHDESCIADAEYRKNTVQKYGHDWHIMTNQECKQTQLVKNFKRWGSRPAISRKIPFRDYR